MSPEQPIAKLWAPQASCQAHKAIGPSWLRMQGPPIHQQAALLISLKALREPGGVWHDPSGADHKVAAIAGPRIEVHLHWELLVISSICAAGVFLCSARIISPQNGHLQL